MQRLQQLMVLWSSSSRMEVLQNSADPIGVNLDEVKAEHIISLTNDLLRLLSSQTPVIGRLIKSCQFTSDSTVFLTTSWSFNFFFCINTLICILQIPLRSLWIQAQPTQS